MLKLEFTNVKIVYICHALKDMCLIVIVYYSQKVLQQSTAAKLLKYLSFECLEFSTIGVFRDLALLWYDLISIYTSTRLTQQYVPNWVPLIS